MLADTFESVWLAVPVKEEDEVVEEMETSSSLEEDSIPVLSRLVSYLVVLWCIFIDSVNQNLITIIITIYLALCGACFTIEFGYEKCTYPCSMCSGLVTHH